MGPVDSVCSPTRTASFQSRNALAFGNRSQHESEPSPERLPRTVTRRAYHLRLECPRSAAPPAPGSLRPSCRLREGARHAYFNMATRRLCMASVPPARRAFYHLQESQRSNLRWPSWHSHCGQSGWSATRATFGMCAHSWLPRYSFSTLRFLILVLEVL